MECNNEWFRESIVDFSNSVNGTSAKEVMDLLILTQYFDTLNEVGGHSRIVFLPSDNDTTRNSLLQAEAASVIKK